MTILTPASQPLPAAKATPEQRLQLLIESVVDYGIFMLDREGFIVSWNSGAQKLTGWQREEIIGRHFSTFYTEDAVQRGWPQEELRRAAELGRFEDEGWRLRRDGSRFWSNVVITALREPDGTLSGFAKVTRDLTERREHEEELRTSEERLRLLVDSVRDHALIMLDPDGAVRSWNAGAEAIHGWRMDEVLGRHFSLFLTPAARAAGAAEAELAQARTEGHADLEAWRMRKDGSQFWAKVRINAVHGVDGQLLGFAKVTQDLSTRRRLEELERSTQRMNEFLAMLGHELRNPLAPIRNAVALLKLDPSTSPVTVKARDVIDRQVLQLAHLVDDLLDVARVATGKIKLRHERVAMREVVTRSIETARPVIDRRGHSLVTQLPQEDLYVQGDPTRLVQVLQNLLINAAKYTPEGGQIRLVLRRRQGQALVSVQDNGKGIDARELATIFELFAQGEAGQSTPSEGGLGVGLALARSLVQMHGGAMRAESAGLGQGATFEFWLPLWPDHARDPAAPAEHKP